MKTNQIIENNKLIATFLNWDVDSIGRYDTPFFVNIDGEEESFLTLTELCFSYDWNWLMLAVEKIESLENVMSFKITAHYTEIQFWNTESIGLISITDLPKIESVYNAVIEFIRFYNEG